MALAAARAPKVIRRAVLAAQTALMALIVVLALVLTLATPVLDKDAQRALLLKHLAPSTPMAGRAAAAMWETARVEALTLVMVVEAKVLTTPLLIPAGVAVLALS